MSSKVFIHWKSNHILTMTKDLTFSEYHSYDTCYNFQKIEFKVSSAYLSYVLSLLNESVDENCIYSSGSKVCYFDGHILQVGLTDIYNMRKLDNNIYYCENVFLIKEENVLHLLKLDQLENFRKEMVNYYPLTELLFVYANNWIKFYKWKTLYDKVCKIQIRQDCAKGWIISNKKHVLLLQI